jgi:hypothetical protein
LLLLLLLLPGTVPAMTNAAPALPLALMPLSVTTPAMLPGAAHPTYAAAPDVLCALQEAPAMPVLLKRLLLLLSGNISRSLLGATLVAPSAAPAVFCASQ